MFVCGWFRVDVVGRVVLIPAFVWHWRHTVYGCCSFSRSIGALDVLPFEFAVLSGSPLSRDKINYVEVLTIHLMKTLVVCLGKVISTWCLSERSEPLNDRRRWFLRDVRAKLSLGT